MSNKRRLWSDLSIRYKLFAAILFAVSIPFVLLLFIHLNRSANESKEQAEISARKVMDETKSYLEYKADSIHEMLNFISFNDIIQREASVSEAYKDINSWAMSDNQVAKVLHQYPYNKDIVGKQLYLRSGLAGEAGNNDYMKIDSIADKGWLDQFKQSRKLFAWVPSTVLNRDAATDQITIIRKIPEAHSVISFSGLASAQISQASIQNVLDHAVLTPRTSAFLFNERGDLLSASTTAKLEALDVKQLLLAKPALLSEAYRWDEHIVFGEHSLLVGATAIQNTTMRLVVVVPESDILATIYQTRNRLLSIFLIIIPCILPLSFIVAGSSTKRLRQLTRHMRKVKDGDFSTTPLIASRDEIGELMTTYNSMIMNMSKLMDETYQLGQEVKNKELKALQAQINPHFLYNTLDLINIMAIENEELDISKVVEKLAVFYKLSLSDGREKISLMNELKHVEAYVSIQNMRFGEGITLNIEVPEHLSHYEVPKIILQPLVENSILHGIREKDTEEGTILVQVSEESSHLIIRISDDGVGMDEKQLTSAIAGKSSKRTGGFGVRNIQERIVLLFGASYGLQYESRLGAGTTVTITLPLKEYKK